MLRLFSTILIFICSTVAAQDARRPLAMAFDEMRAKNWAVAQDLAIQDGQPALDVVVWTKLRAGQGTPAEAINFLARNGDWPGLPYLRKRSEPTFDQATAEQILTFFANDLPQTAEGAYHYARVLKQRGQTDKARLIVQNIWVDAVMSQELQDRYVAEFGPWIKELHVPRAMALMWRDEHGAVEQMYPLLDAGHLALAKARVGLRTKSEGVDPLIAAVPANLRSEPVLAHARFEWRLRAGLRDSAVALLGEQSKSAIKLGTPQAWANSRERIVRDMIWDGKFSNAYDLIRSHHLSQGDDFATFEWLAGFIALRKLNKPKVALDHFSRFLTAVDTPISLGRGYYWQGRALEALNRTSEARDAYARGAQHQTSYYGILAAERVGQTFGPEFTEWSDLPDWRQAEFLNGSVFQAAVLLFAADQLPLGERFLTHLAETLDETDTLRLTDFLEEAQRPHVLVMLGKRAASMGTNIPRPYFALHPMIKQKTNVPPELSLAIARRESEFDHLVVSPVGAMGLMQLMPKTAQEMAGKVGVSYSAEQLRQDWVYNARLGNAYLAELGERFGGNPVLMSIAYNAGPTRAERWSAKLGDPRGRNIDIIDWVEMIPFTETRNYVMRVTESLPIYRARLGLDPLPKPFSQMLQGSSLKPFAP